MLVGKMFFNKRLNITKTRQLTDEVVDVGGPNFEAVHGGVPVALLGRLDGKNLRKWNLLVVVGARVRLVRKNRSLS